MRATNPKSIVSALLFVGTAAVLAHPYAAYAQVGPYQYYAVTPCRAYDTRTGQPSAAGDGSGIVTAGTTRTFRMRGFCGIPTSASAISGNFTIVNPTAIQGDLRLAPYPGTFPTVSTSNYYQGEVVANGAIVPLGTVNPGSGDDLQVIGAGYPFTQAWTFHLLIDITGYFQ